MLSMRLVFIKTERQVSKVRYVQGGTMFTWKVFDKTLYICGWVDVAYIAVLWIYAVDRIVSIVIESLFEIEKDGRS